MIWRLKLQLPPRYSNSANLHFEYEEQPSNQENNHPAKMESTYQNMYMPTVAASSDIKLHRMKRCSEKFTLPCHVYRERLGIESTLLQDQKLKRV
jgi:hypothetical protein